MVLSENMITGLKYRRRGTSVSPLEDKQMSENSKNTVQRKQTAGQGVKAQLTPEQAARLAARRAQANGTAAKPAVSP